MTNNNLFNITMENVQNVGSTKYVNAPLDILTIDEKFQRIDSNIGEKVRRLVQKWDANKLDPIVVSVHWESGKLSVLDGLHRYLAAQELGLATLPAKLISIDGNATPSERLKIEAEIFATQTDEVDVLTPLEKHKANIIRGIQENVIIDKLTKKYDIPLKKNRAGGRTTKGVLTGFTQALWIARCGEDILDKVFYALCASRWNMERGGMSANALSCVFNILKFHPDCTETIMDGTIKLFKYTSPSHLFADAYAKYPNRGEKVRNALYLEDYFVDTYGIDRVYFGDSNINVPDVEPITLARYLELKAAA